MAPEKANAPPLEPIFVEELSVIRMEMALALAERSSCESIPVKAPSRRATSSTVRPMGPAVSWVCEIGMIPLRLIRPTVGLSPTTPQNEDGPIIEPSVSVPIATAQRLAAGAAAEPELEPEGLRSRAYGLRVRPPRPLQPLVLHWSGNWPTR